MKLTSQELFDEFYKTHKEEYPNLSYAQMKDAVFAPWEYFRNLMRDGNLVSMRFKYLGVFTVYVGQAKYELVKLKDRFNKGTMLDKEYFRIKGALERFIQNEEKNS